jgi:hypothetical protein
VTKERWFAAGYNTRMQWLRLAGYAWKSSRIYAGKPWDQLAVATTKKLKENVK